MGGETGWMIERPGPDGMPEYLTPFGQMAETPERADFDLRWSSNSWDGLRFARRKDAITFLGVMRNLMDKLPHKETVSGLRWDDKTPNVADHAWMGDAWRGNPESPSERQEAP